MRPALTHSPPRGALAACLLLLCGTADVARPQFQRAWQVYVAPFSHVDVGYTAPVPDVLDAQQRYLDTVVAYCQRSALLPDGEKFAWTVEETWPLEAYVRSRPQNRVETLFTLVREGRVEVGAQHFSLQTDLCGNEELVRSLSVSRSLSTQYGFSVKTAVINDTPGFTWGLCEVLSQAGIPYLSVAMNSFLSSFYTTTTLPYLFYWEAQSGARTLVWRCIDKQWAYLEGSVTVGVYAGYPVFKQRLTEFLNRLESEGYPYDEVFVNAGTGDNGPPNYAIVGNVRQWNQEYPGTKVRISTMSQFFDTVAARHGGVIPMYRGDAPNWWTWSFASSATGGMAVSREAQRLIPEAELWSTVARMADPAYDYPERELSEAYVNNLYFEDHNLGSINPSGNAPFWTLKMGWVDSARSTGAGERERAIAFLAGGIRTDTGPAIAVLNGLLHPRGGIVTVPLTDPALPAGPFDVIDALTGRTMTTQVLSDGHLAFYADSVPAAGYRLYTSVPNPGKPWTPASLTSSILENSHYRVTVSLANGSITGMLDKQAGVDLAAGTSGFNLYRYNSSQFASGLTVAGTDSGAVLQRLTIRGNAPGTSGFRTTLLLPEREKTLGIDNRYVKNVPTTLESIDFLFGTSLSSPRLVYDIPFAVARLFDDELSGFRVNHYAARRWLNIRSGADDLNVTIAPLSTPLHAYPPAGFDGTVRFLVSFNDVGTAYRAGTGDLDVGFVLTSRAEQFRSEIASLFAGEAATPLIARVIPAGQGGGLHLGPGEGAVAVSPHWLVVSTLKGAEGTGAVMRLFNPTDTQVACSLTTHHGFSASPVETDLFGAIRGMIPVTDNTAMFGMNPREIKTIRFDPVTITAVAVSHALPQDFRVEQNYPNPCNPVTAIEYRIMARDRVYLSVFDMLGREVAVLVDEVQERGRHRVMFDASGIASGVYVYRLVSGAGSQSRKMVVLR